MRANPATGRALARSRSRRHRSTASPRRRCGRTGRPAPRSRALTPSCHLPQWLVAAIGKVESDHGRYGGNTVGSDGVSSPGIFGIALDGSHGTASISDTDDGRLDGDRLYDRAVGPMQFIPGTWAAVGTDGDGDGVANPQDIDDAALASGIYLCSGGDDLSTKAGAQAAVFRYNHSDEYVNAGPVDRR